VGLIAEVKRRSPSAGAINLDLDPAALAMAYADGGAAAISVLTEAERFGGSLEDLGQVVAHVRVPVLRKDFLVDPLQLLEARGAGASAVLLIVRALDDGALRTMLAETRELGMAALVEAHDAPELARALDAGAPCIGINARNLDDFSMHHEEALRLVAAIPGDRMAVAESGITVRDDVERAASAGADAVLVGGALAAAGDPRALARALCGVSRRGR
jgi:indole-3-glycerol phosphate synthase